MYMAQAYGNTLQLVVRRRREKQEKEKLRYVDYETQKFQDSITEIQWLENDLLILFTSSGKLHAYSCSKHSILVSTSLGADGFTDYTASSSSSKAYFSERDSRGQVIRAIYLRTATERLSMLIGSNRWIPALASGLEMCTFVLFECQTKSKTNYNNLNTHRYRTKGWCTSTRSSSILSA